MAEEIKIIWPTQGNTITTQSGMIYTIGQPINSGGYALVFEGLDFLIYLIYLIRDTSHIFARFTFIFKSNA